MTHESRPLVALTTSFEPQAGAHRRPQVIVYDAYISALDRAGLAVVLISPSHSPDAIASLLDHCHGLVLSGGGDIDPSRYGEQPTAELDSVSVDRDQTEFEALRGALDRDLAILGICRGVQVMNVFLGGTLHQDIDAARGGVQRIAHQQAGPWGARAHDVTISEGSRLREIAGSPEIHINSFHHQAIKRVAPSLTVTALAEDGTVEAVEMQDCTWGLGVQWHPERHEASAPASDPDRRLFDAFAQAVHARRDGVAHVRTG
jgi:gamma-glutamyl-gamma-aminobutyrate hydrolase PuuD